MARRVSSPVFVGRAGELSALRGALERAGTGVPGVALVTGESGVGKSRLLAELLAGARDAETLVLTGDCVELGEGELPYAPIVGALRDLVRQLGSAPFDPLPVAGRAELGRLVPELTTGTAAQGAPSQPVLFEAVLALLARLAEERPVVLALEDVHWADRSTRDLLAFLARNLTGERVLIVAVYRSDELHRRHPLRNLLAELERLPGTERVELARLSLAEVEEQLTAILETAPTADLVARVHARSEGNPFFAEELVAAGAEGSLPGSLRDALMLRIEALPEEAQGLLRVLAVAGRPVPGELLAAAAGRSDDALSAPLRSAVDNNIAAVSDDGLFRFRHALYGEAVYDDLLPGDRARLHRALAQALAGDPELGASQSIGAVELAHHWQAAHDLPAALAAAVKAGHSSRAAGALAEAARQYGVALELWEQVPDAEERAGASHAALMRHAAEAADLAADHDQAAALFRRAAEEFEAAGEPEEAAIALSRLGRCLWSAGWASEGLEAHSRAVELMPDAPTAERAEVLALRARALMMGDLVGESLPVAEEALAIAREVGAPEAEGHALNTLGVDVAQLGDRERGIEHLRAALRIATDLARPEDIGSAYVNLSDSIDQAGRIEEAAELAIEGIAACERLGVGRLMGAFLAGEAVLRLIRLGRYERAERLMEDALRLRPEGVSEAALRQARAQLLIERGDPEAGKPELELVREMTERTKDSMWIGPFAATDTELALWRGDPDEASGTAERALGSLGEVGFPFATAPLHAHAMRAEADRRARARALSEADDAGRTGELRARLQSLLTQGVAPEVQAWVALAHAEAERAEGAAAAAESFGQAADRFAELAIPFRTAYARWREAEAALAGGAPGRDVAGPLGEAHGLASEIGAPLLLAEIEGLARRGRVPLEAAAEPAPATAQDGEPSAGDRLGLTPRELEVLVLVAEGHTNKEIGERLYMSSKTASVHVSRILVKLSARNRGEAAAAAHRLGLAGEADPP